MMGYHLSALYKEAGLPDGVLHLLPGGPDVGKALVADPRIHVIAFTGSKEARLEIIRQAAQRWSDDNPLGAIACQGWASRPEEKGTWNNSWFNG